MREIIFKGKDWLGNWHIGSIVHKLCENNSKANYYANSGMCNHIIKAGDYYIIDEDGEGFWVLPETISQYTGMTSKNGVKIFEGDCIRSLVSGEIGVVRYGKYYQSQNDDCCGSHIGFYVHWVSVVSKNYFRRDLGFWNEYVDVIGNIHDNPELMEGGTVNG